MPFIVSLFVFMGSIFVAIMIIGYVVGGISCINDQVKKTELSMKEFILQELRKEHSELYYVCGWCLGVFERSTDRKVATLDHIKEAVSHSICEECKLEQLAKSKEVN